MLCERNKYQYAIFDPHHVQRDLQHALEQPAITRVCTSIRKEMLPYFYAQNEFGFQDNGDDRLKGLAVWIQAIGETNYKHLHKLFILSASDELEDYIVEQYRRKGFPFIVSRNEVPVYNGRCNRYRLAIPSLAERDSVRGGRAYTMRAQ